MMLEPLLNASFAIQFHVATVVPAAFIGAFLLARRKGTYLHRLFGKLWLALMGLTSVSSLFVHELRIWGDWSPIHLLSLYVIVGCFSAYAAVRRGRIVAHRRIVTGLYVGGIVVAGAFTFMPGRIMNAVVFSGSLSSSLAGTGAMLAAALVACWPLLRRRSIARTEDIHQ